MSSQPSNSNATKIENSLQNYFSLINSAKELAPERLRLHPAQEQIKKEAKRFNVLDCGRRFGKTRFLCDLLVETATQGFPAGYFAPTYKLLMDGWRDLLQMTESIRTRKDEQEKRIELKTGGVIECWSLDGEGAGGKKDYRAGRSRKYKRVVIDEAAMVESLAGVYEYAIEPTLLDYKGDVWFASTPNGKNAFYRFWRKGDQSNPERESDWMSWQMPTTANTTIPHLKDEVEKYRLTKTKEVFEQEYLAKFLEDSGQVFRNLTACTHPLQDKFDDEGKLIKKGIWQEKALPFHVYVVAWDLAKKNDFSVIGVIDCTTKQLVYMERFNNIEYMIQIPRLIGIVEKFQPVEVVVEENGNLALMELLHIVKYKKVGPAPRLQKTGILYDEYSMMLEATARRLEDYTTDKHSHMAVMPITEFKATNASKEEAVQALVLAFEREEIGIFEDPVLLNELESFGMERLPSGKFRYAAPEGEHDDTVLMLCEGWYRARRYMSEERLPIREKAIRHLPADMQPDALKNNTHPMAEISANYYIHGYEIENEKKPDHFLSRFANLGR